MVRLGRQMWRDSIHRTSSLSNEAKGGTAHTGATHRAGKQSGWKGLTEDHVGKAIQKNSQFSGKVVMKDF